MSLPAYIESGLVAGIIINGIVIEGLGPVHKIRQSLPQWQRTTIYAWAIGVVWTAYYLGAIPTVVFSASTYAVALSVGSWLALPYVFDRWVNDGPVTDPGADPVVGQHFQPRGDAEEPGVYRVVDVSDTVSLRRVADGSGDRIDSGEVRQVPVDVVDANFATAPNPEENPTFLEFIKSVPARLRGRGRE